MTLSIRVSEIVEQTCNPLLGKHSTWKRVLLGEISSILNGFAFKSADFTKNDGVPLIRIRDVGKDSTETNYVGTFDHSYVVLPGDLLVGMDGDFRSAIWNGPKGLLNQRVCKIVLTTKNYLPQFLKYVLPGYLNAINEATSSVTVKHLSSRSLQEIPLPFPPLPEQHRIVNKIEELFTQLDAGVDLLQKTKILLNQYRQSVLKAAFEGKLTEEWRKKNRHQSESVQQVLFGIQLAREIDPGKLPQKEDSELPEVPEEWGWTSLPFIGELNRGKSKHRPRNDPKLYGGPYPFIQTGDISNSNGRITEYRQTYNELGLKQSKLWSKGTLCITIAANIAETGILEFAACFPDSIVGFTCEPEQCNIRFVEFFLRSVRSNIERYAPATAQKNINLQILSSLAVPFPSLQEQRTIVDSIDEHFSVADSIERTIETNLKLSGNMKQGILRNAFQGKLVPQDPTDEPASKLLERIKTERSTKTPRDRKPRQTKMF